MRVINLKLKSNNKAINKSKRNECFSILNSQFLLQRGFTIIELLVVIAVIGIVGSMTFAILLSTIRTSKKAAIITTARQNGNAAISQMSRTIRYGTLTTPASCDGSAKSSISIKASDKVTTYVYACSSSLTQSINGGAASPLINTSEIVLDTTAGSCSFTCTRSNPSAPPVVAIQFTLRSTNQALAEVIASVPFKTTVLMRNQ